MDSAEQSSLSVRVGDLDGLGKIYSVAGDLIPAQGEKILALSHGWDANVSSPWRRVLPKVIFAGFGGKASSKLFVTTERVVLIREIDVWRELKEELSPLGIPTAAAKEVRLKQLKASGTRQFCEIWPRNFRVVKMKKLDRGRSWLDLRLLGNDGRQYEIILWKTDGLDTETLSLIQSRFSGLDTS
jgi:hypothetical protein